MARRGNIKKTCPICGNEFFIFPSDIVLNRGKYCSIVCGRRANETRVLKECPVCHKAFYADKYSLDRGHGVYCSHDCYGKTLENKITLSCIVCGKEFSLQPCQAKDRAAKFCSQHCHGIYRRTDNAEIKRAIRSLHKTRTWKRLVLEKDSHQCQLCGCRKSTHKTLHVHHIIPMLAIVETYNIDTIDKAISCNKLWDVNNGITYCEQCHYLVHSGKHIQSEIEWS